MWEILLSEFGSKTRVEDRFVLDVNEFNSQDLLQVGVSGSWTWYRGSDDEKEERASISWEVVEHDGGRALRLLYTVPESISSSEKREVDYVVPLSFTECNYGGERPWFLCPEKDCGRRVAKLYKPPTGDLFLCRECHDLTYQSSQRSGISHYENIIKPLKRYQEAEEELDKHFTRENLRELYDARKELEEGRVKFSEKLADIAGVDPPSPRFDTLPPDVRGIFGRNRGKV